MHSNLPNKWQLTQFCLDFVNDRVYLGDFGLSNDLEHNS